MDDIMKAFLNPPTFPGMLHQLTSSTTKDSLFEDVDVDHLSPQVKNAFIHIFVISLQTAFRVGIVMGALCLVSSVLMMIKKRKREIPIKVAGGIIE